MGAAFGLGFVIGPVLGGFLGEYGSRVPFFATAGLIFFNLIVGLIFLPESHAPSNRRPFEIRRANPFSAMKQMSQFKIVLRDYRRPFSVQHGSPRPAGRVDVLGHRKI